MKSSGPFLAVATLFLALGSGCRHPTDPVLLSALDSLILRTDSLMDGLDTIDLIFCDQMDSVFRTQRDPLEALLRDTLARDQAVAIGNYYRAMDRSLGRVRGKTKGVRDELSVTREQLEDLRHDIDNGLLPEGPRKTYFEQERLTVDQLAQSVQVILNSYRTATREWNAQHHGVAEILAPPSSP